MRKIIETPAAAGPRGADGGLASGLEAQIAQAIENMRQILGSEGGQLSDLVTVTCYITDKDDFPTFNGLSAMFRLRAPARQDHRGCKGAAARRPVRSDRHGLFHALRPFPADFGSPPDADCQ